LGQPGLRRRQKSEGPQLALGPLDGKGGAGSPP